MLRLLCVTAHPDDEAGAFGGTLLHYHHLGVTTHIICLTAGTAARHRGGARTDEELAAMRRREFAASCDVLCVTDGEVWDFPDAGLDRTDLYAVVGRLARRIRELRPHVVLTFGPEGSLTAHTDHGMAGVFATVAFQWAGRTNRFPEQLEDEEMGEGRKPWRAQKLYYVTSAFTLPERQPVALPPATAALAVGQYFETKVRAFRCHTSQAPLFEIFEKNVAGHGRDELYHLAAAITPRRMEWETDLFAGVEDTP